MTTERITRGSRSRACEQSILDYNGVAMLAMTGKDCVGICSDSRLGVQAQTVATDFEKIFKMGDKLMVSKHSVLS